MIKFLLALVDCYRESLRKRLSGKIETLTESLSHQDKSFEERQSIFQQLQSAEEELAQTKSILPAALPKQIVNLIASLSTKVKENSVWVNKFDLLCKSEQPNQTGPKLPISEWVNILNNAHTVLTDSDWQYISNHVVSTIVFPQIILPPV